MYSFPSISQILQPSALTKKVGYGQCTKGVLVNPPGKTMLALSKSLFEFPVLRVYCSDTESFSPISDHPVNGFPTKHNSIYSGGIVRNTVSISKPWRLRYARIIGYN